eukprot:3932960-Rhodomonas_salina.1
MSACNYSWFVDWDFGSRPVLMLVLTLGVTSVRTMAVIHSWIQQFRSDFQIQANVKWVTCVVFTWFSVITMLEHMNAAAEATLANASALNAPPRGANHEKRAGTGVEDFMDAESMCSAFYVFLYSSLCVVLSLKMLITTNLEVMARPQMGFAAYYRTWALSHT